MKPSDDDIVRFTNAQWAELVGKYPHLPVRLLDAAEVGGREAVRALLDEHGIGYQEVNL